MVAGRVTLCVSKTWLRNCWHPNQQGTNVPRDDNVWPFLCVGPTTCCTNPWASNVPLKRTASASWTLSRWTLRSPVMITSLVITARRSKYKLHSSKNTLFLRPFRLEGGGRYTMHNLTFTSLEMTVQSICSKCVNMPLRVESKVLMVNPIYRARLHLHRASHWVERCVVFG